VFGSPIHRPQVGGLVLPSRLCLCRKDDKTKALADLKKAIELQPSLMGGAVKEAGFKNPSSDPDFKKLTE
jgi:hypothetical protein